VLGSVSSEAVRAVRLAIDSRSPQSVLDASRAAVLDGEYAAARRGFEWFHRKAVQYEGSNPVRLSFALHDWSELCDLYEPALVGFEKILDRGAKRLQLGSSSFHLFQEVVAMYRMRGRGNEALALFRGIAQKSQERARRFGAVIRPLLLAEGDYATCARFTKATRELNTLLEVRDMEVAFANPGIDPDRFFGRRLDVLLEVLWGARQFAEARQIHAIAVDRVATTSILEAFDRAKRRVAAKRSERRKSMSSISSDYAP
jgi:hypothetical protein